MPLRTRSLVTSVEFAYSNVNTIGGRNNLIIPKEKQKEVLRSLENLTTPDSLRELFQSVLDYDFVGDALPARLLSDPVTEVLSESPTLFATGGQNNDFHVIYSRIKGDSLSRGIERQAINGLIKEHPYSLFVFSNEAQTLWHFVNVRYDEESKKRRILRRISVGKDERLRTASERISMLSLDNLQPGLFGLAPLEIQKLHDDAFNVEAITRQFFDNYKSAFNILQSDLTKQTRDPHWAHDYALQFLNRCMFLYFIQRKRWLGNDTEFLKSFWESYSDNSTDQDVFFSKWLKVLFFEAFNNKKTLLNAPQRSYIPESMRKILWEAPYLNGGLFSENELDSVSYDFNIADSRFKQIFNFLEGYNFTIAEDSPLDQEVAVDPEMIGKVYESLVNVSTEADERGDAGIFYTPRTEIDLMCRLSLVDNFARNLGSEHKNLFYELLFALEPQEKQEADEKIEAAKLWDKVDKRLREITVVDPACGSGSFLVGMLHVINDLRCRADDHLGKTESPFERKKEIIGRNLYGVDVMDWAAHIAELRMWLALIIDADFEPIDLYQRDEPLLPHFSFKIRTGDSLVQEIGGLSFNNWRKFRGEVSASIKTRITKLRDEKTKFFNNDPTCKFKNKHALEHEEASLFRDLLHERYVNLEKEITTTRNYIESPTEKSVDLFTGEVEEHVEQRSLKEVDYRHRLARAEEDLEKVKLALDALQNVKETPFVWDISFVEIFSGDRNGFDILIGNPPYVRHQNIANPRLERSEISPQNKRSYKAKLQRSVYQAYPNYFSYDERKDTAAKKLDSKCDLYVYFYFLSLQHLNPNGTFCFITSNSWLDVGYGAVLQEFLLKRCHIEMIIDNSDKRSFESADINTVIALISAPIIPSNPNTQQHDRMNELTRFVLFNTEFENVLSPVVFEEIEASSKRFRTPEYRVYPITQEVLLNDGIDRTDESSVINKSGLAVADHYIGNKWGAKYLRSPDILTKILSNKSDLLTTFGQQFNVGTYLNTGGADDFFFLDHLRQSGGIVELESRITSESITVEARFLKVFLESPRQLTTRTADPATLSTRILVINSDDATKKTLVHEYIKTGERRGFNNASGRRTVKPWYKSPSGAFFGEEILFPCRFGDNFYLVWNPAKVISHRFYRLKVRDEQVNNFAAWAVGNSTLVWLCAELFAGSSLGGGVLDINGLTIKQIPFPRLDKLPVEDLVAAGTRLALEPLSSVQGQLQSEAVRELDDIVFESLKLTGSERQEIYDAVYELVSKRINKADSLKKPQGRGISKRLEAVARTQGAWQGVPDFELEEP